MADPINPRQSGEELLEQILRECPHLSRDDVLTIASAAGFDLLDLRRNPNSPPAPGAARRNTARQPAEKTRPRQ